MISKEEKALAKESIRMALEAGAQGARVSLSKSSMNLVSTLNGEVDRVTSCQDCSISIAVFADGRYGSFSTNKLGRGDLKDFIGKAVEMTKLLAPDPFRRLAAPERLAKDAIDGNELGLYDAAFEGVTPERRIAFALENAVYGRQGHCCSGSLPPRTGSRNKTSPEQNTPGSWRLISEEGEYSDSDYHNYVVDSNGLEAIHCETSFEYGTEVTIEDAKGNKFSGGWWEASPSLKGFKPELVGSAALNEAVAQIGPKPCRSGKYTLVIDSEVSTKVVNPILGALNAYNVQQKNSFLADALGKAVFPEGLTLMDLPRSAGETGSKYFDSEGVATANHCIIDKGTVKEFFVNSYMAGKTGMAPTCEDAIRPRLLPWAPEGKLLKDRQAIMDYCGEGILVTDFVGGNCNTATGDFSYAIQGYRFKAGKVVCPVREMLVTGNIVSLWQGFIAAGDDARVCRAKLIPSLAFANVDFSG